MFPSEMVILLSIALSNGTDQTLISRPLDVMKEYIGGLYASLVKRGYLTESGLEKYKFTSKGNKALIKFIGENRSRADYIIKALHLLGVETSHKIEEFNKELIGSK